MSAPPVIAGVRLGPAGPAAAADPTRPLLVVGPALGTSGRSLWGEAGALLSQQFHVVAWDLPGHGASPPATDPFTVTDLATGLLSLVDQILTARGETGGSFHVAGDSLGGAAALQLLLDQPARVRSATLLCTGAKILTVESWSERAELVRASGTGPLVETAVERWFGPGFADRRPDIVDGLLKALADADPSSYVWACQALAGYDVRQRLGEIERPVLAVAGTHDVSTPVASLQEVVDGVGNGELVVLDGVGHLAPAEAPAAVARLITRHAGSPDPHTVEGIRAAGLAVRRAVLGADYVDQATARTTDFTRDFQDLITQFAWGTIWTRPGLDRRSRSMIAITALVAGGHHEELALHIRAARTNGLTDEEIKETLLQSAIYCSVPSANTAFRVAQRVLAELDAEAADGAQ
jgi:3-oxoadipate enol-lactonase/4-carboxymuconolactone decarboxylase